MRSDERTATSDECRFPLPVRHGISQPRFASRRQRRGPTGPKSCVSSLREKAWSRPISVFRMNGEPAVFQTPRLSRTIRILGKLRAAEPISNGADSRPFPATLLTNSSSDHETSNSISTQQDRPTRKGRCVIAGQGEKYGMMRVWAPSRMTAGSIGHPLSRDRNHVVEIAASYHAPIVRGGPTWALDRHAPP